MSAATRYKPREYFVEDEMKSGDVILERKPLDFLKLIVKTCEKSDLNGALYELLAPVFTSDTPAVKELRDTLWRYDYTEFFDIADEAMGANRR